MLKIKTITIILTLAFLANAQDLSFRNAEIKINSISGSDIYFIFNYNGKLDRSKTLRAFKNSQNTFQLVDLEEDRELFAGMYKNLAMQDSAFIFEIVIKNQKMLDKIYQKQNAVYLNVLQDFKIYNAENTDSLIVTTEFVKNQSLSMTTFSERQLQLLGGALDSNYIATKSNVDFAKDIINEDSTKSEYSLRFNLSGKLMRLFDVPFYFKVEGRASTIKNNPLNQIETYLTMGLTQNFSFDAGVVSNQTFKRYAYRVNINYETLLPNFINLSLDNNRLRLKPYLNLALALHKNVQDNPVFEDKDPKLMLTGNFYYPIPVGKKYTFIFLCDAVWSDSFTKDNLLFTYQASLVYDTPLEDLKVLLKAESGQKLFYTEKDTKLLLGLLLDITNM